MPDKVVISDLDTSGSGSAEGGLGRRLLVCCLLERAGNRTIEALPTGQILSLSDKPSIWPDRPSNGRVKFASTTFDPSQPQQPETRHSPVVAMTSPRKGQYHTPQWNCGR